MKHDHEKYRAAVPLTAKVITVLETKALCLRLGHICRKDCQYVVLRHKSRAKKNTHRSFNLTFFQARKHRVDFGRLASQKTFINISDALQRSSLSFIGNAKKKRLGLH